MTTSEALNTINENLEAGARSTNDLFQYHQSIEARATATVEHDIQAIKDTLSCINGMCFLQWKPAR